MNSTYIEMNNWLIFLLKVMQRVQYANVFRILCSYSRNNDPIEGTAKVKSLFLHSGTKISGISA